MAQSAPKLFVSKYTREGGVLVYVVFRHYMQVTRELTDREAALGQYRRHRGDLFHWHEGQRVYEAPEEPQVFDGDAGVWVTTL